MSILGFDFFTGLGGIVIITMILVVVKANVHKIPFPGRVMGKALNALSSPASFFIDRLSYNPFLYPLFSGNKSPHRHVHVILRRRICADHSRACASGHPGHELRFSIL